jgi:chaperonin cofactor prefoldin
MSKKELKKRVEYCERRADMLLNYVNILMHKTKALENEINMMKSKGRKWGDNNG